MATSASGTAPAPGTAPPPGPAGAAQPAPGYGYPARTPSGLFPSGPPRPAYREPHPVRAPAVAAGLAVGALWMLLLGMLGTSLRSYGWFTLVAGGVAWAVALLLARVGDRGVAVGVAISIGIGWAVAWFVMVVAWSVGEWPLW